MPLAGYTSESNLYENKQNVEHFREKELYLLFKKSSRGGLSGVHWPDFLKSDGGKVLTEEAVNIINGLSMTKISV